MLTPMKGSPSCLDTMQGVSYYYSDRLWGWRGEKNKVSSLTWHTRALAIDYVNDTYLARAAAIDTYRWREMVAVEVVILGMPYILPWVSGTGMIIIWMA